MTYPNGMTPRCSCPYICKNDGKQGSCYMYSSGKRPYAFYYVPKKRNSYGLGLIFNNTTFTLTSSNKGAVGTSALASRAYNKGRASVRNFNHNKFTNQKKN